MRGTAKLTGFARQLPDEAPSNRVQAAPIPPPEIIQHAVWLYYRFNVSHRYVEDILAWRAVDQDGGVVDVLLQERRDANAAKCFIKRLLAQGYPRKIVSDRLGSYAVARRELIPDSIHETSRYANNRAELSHQPTRVRERGLRRFKSMLQAQRFVGVHAAVSNLFNLGRHLVAADHYRTLRRRAFTSWDHAAAV